MDSEDRSETAPQAPLRPAPWRWEPNRDAVDTAVREQAELLATGQRLARMGSVVFDIADETWTISENWAAHIGVDRTVLTRQDVHALIPPDDHAIANAAFEGFFTGEAQEYEHRIIHARSGGTLHVRAYATLVRDASGQPLRVVGAVQDITDRKRAEQALKASEARFRALFNSMPLNLAVWKREGDDFVLTEVNAASVTLTHDQISALLGSRLSVFYSDMPWMRDLVWRCHRGGTLEHAERPYRFRATGEEKRLNLKFASVPPDIVLVVAEDVTEKSAAEQALLASEARFRGLFEAIPDSLAVWRRDGDDYVLEDVNPANERLSGGRIRAHIGRRLSDFYRDRPDLVALVHRCGQSGTVETLESLYRMRSTGEERHLRFKFAPVPPDLVLAIGEDIEDRMRAEIRLRETAGLLLNAEEMAGIGSWEWDVEADAWTFSDNWCRLHGVETVPRTTADLLPIAHPDDIARIEAAFDGALNGAPYDITHRIIHQTTGEVRTVMVRGSPLLDDDGRVVKIRGVGLDVTEREGYERTLRETTDLMVAGQRLGRMGSFEYDIETGRWSLSETWRELSGAEVGPETTDALMAWIHPDDREGVGAQFRAMLRGETQQMEHRVIHYRTGETLHLRAYGNLVHDDRGRPTRFRGLVQDITREKQRELALADNLMRLAMAQKIARIGSATIDPTVERTDWSEEMYRIFERDPALGPPRLGDHADLYAPDGYRMFRDAVDAAVAEAVPFEMTVPLHMPDGRVKWVLILGRPMPDRGPAGHVVHTTVQDITARKRDEEFREDIERIVSHDMRSPMAAVVSGINILRLSDALSDDNRDVLDMMERAARGQLSLLDASMTLHRMEAGTFRFEPVAVDLGAVFQEVHEELEHLAAEGANEIRLSMAAPVSALGDAWLCRTLLSNLIRNAVEALPAERQTVEVSVTAEEGEAVVRVTNPGAVPGAVRDRFFEKYTTSGKSGGTGLGTYSAFLMARAQGGRVALDASVPDQTTVTVRLPLWAPDGTAT